MLSSLKLIVILREPIERELSSYNHKVYDYKQNGVRGWINQTWYRDVINKSDGTIKSFTEYCEFVKEYFIYGAPTYAISRYVEHLRKWVSLFDRKQLLVLSYDELRNDPSSVQKRVEEFLGKKFEGTLKKSNDSGGPAKVQEVPKGAVNVLYPVFHVLNLELYDFLSKNQGPPMEQYPFPHFDEHVDRVMY